MPPVPVWRRPCPRATGPRMRAGPPGSSTATPPTSRHGPRRRCAAGVAGLRLGGAAVVFVVVVVVAAVGVVVATVAVVATVVVAACVVVSAVVSVDVVAVVVVDSVVVVSAGVVASARSVPAETPATKRPDRSATTHKPLIRGLSPSYGRTSIARRVRR